MSPEQRAEDLLSRMSLEDKAGQLFHSQIGMGPGGALADADPAFGLPSTEEFVLAPPDDPLKLARVVVDRRLVASWHNRLQELAASTRARASRSPSPPIRGTPSPTIPDRLQRRRRSRSGRSRWAWPRCGDAELVAAVRRHRPAGVPRGRASGVALHPQVDLATEPRWARQSARFGEDADLTGELAVAYVRGFQGADARPGVGRRRMTKHFPGGGPQLDGEDPHFAYGREQVYPGNNFEYHLEPFEAAIEAGASQIMPYYGMPVGTELEEVGFGFNKRRHHRPAARAVRLRRHRLHRLGPASPTPRSSGQPMPGARLGRGAPQPARAGRDGAGRRLRPVRRRSVPRARGRAGQSRPGIEESRIDVSVRRLLLEKFRLGLFDQPYVDVDAAAAIVGRADFVDAGSGCAARLATRS